MTYGLVGGFREGFRKDWNSGKKLNALLELVGIIFFVVGALCSFSVTLLTIRSSFRSSSGIRFGDIQTVRLWPREGDPNLINLNNLGSLSVDIFNVKTINSISLHNESIGLVLNAAPSFRNDSAGSFKLMNYNEKDQYQFDTTNNKVNEVKIKNKTFLVTLYYITSIGTPQRPNYEYTFGIAEE
jgi:hypothetical protein